jgi:hypothetical protein
MIVLLVIAVLLAWSSPVQACPDGEYEAHLEALRALVPAVSVESPPRDALADFFNALPSGFACFNRIFGYDDGPAPLYSNPLLHFLLPKIAETVPRPAYARKLVGLSVSGKWEADQTGALQREARSVLDADTQLFGALLGEYSSEAERSVWDFLFGGPHPSNTPLSPRVQAQLCAASTRSCELAKLAYEHALAEEQHH